MKKLVLLTIAIFITTFSFSQELKGYRLGTVYNGSEIVKATISGIEGILSIQRLNDKRIYQIVFIPTKGENIKRIYNYTVELFINTVEAKYNIKFEKTQENEFIKDYIYHAETNDAVFYIRVKINEFINPPCELAFIISNKELYDIYTEEERQKIMHDI
jgi:hypothetical protein